MAVSRKRQVLDLEGQELVHLEVLPELPLCFGSYEVGLCTGEFCSHVFERCKRETIHARNTEAENLPVPDGEEVRDVPSR